VFNRIFKQEDIKCKLSESALLLKKEGALRKKGWILGLPSLR
jgi:hypothetical protein